MLAKFSVKKPMTVLVCMVLILLLGVVSFTRMTPDLLPNLDFPYVVIVTSYPGASPEQVESEVTRPIEQSVAVLENITDIQSTSSENVSMVMLEFSDDANMDATTMNIREKLDQLGGSWNDKVGQPYILKMNPNMLPVNVSAVAREGYSTVELSSFVEEMLLPQLEGTEGVASISTSGMISERLHVVFRQDAIDALNARIRAAIDAEFLEAEEEIADGRAELENGQKKLTSGQQMLNKGKQELESTAKEAEQQFDAAEAELETQQAELRKGTILLRAQLAGMDALLATEPTVRSQLDALLALPSPTPEQALLISQLTNALHAIENAKAEREQVAEQLQQAEAGLAAIEEGFAQLGQKREDAASGLTDAKSQLSAGQRKINNARLQMQEAEGQLDDAESQLGEAREAAYASSDAKEIVSLSTVSAILSAQNFAMPAGYAAADDDTQWLVYVGDTIQSAEELSSLVLLDLGLDTLPPVRLSDVADVLLLNNASQTYAKINGQDGVLLAFYKQSNYATATVSENILHRFRSLEDANAGLSFTALMDQGSYIHIVIDSVLQNLALGAVLAVLILLLFLRDLRPTFIVACSIPISVTFAIVLMYFSGITLNVISMSGLAVGVGMLVDNSIVVIENIYRLRSEGVSVFRAAIAGASQVAGAITASTLTTVCVFLPIVFVQGMTRQLFVDMALTIAYSLLASLFIALTLVPAMGSGLLKKAKKQERRFFLRLQDRYEKLLSFALRKKTLVIFLSVVLLAISAMLSISRGFSYMPAMDSTQMSVSITLAEDALLEDTALVCDEVAERFRALPQVETVGVMQASGMASMMGMGSGNGSENAATMYVVLREGQTADSNALAVEMEEMCADLPAEITVSGSSMDMSVLSGSGVAIRIYGDDQTALLQTARDVAGILRTVDGIASVSDGVEDTTPELKVTVDREKAILSGLTTAQVYQKIAEALATEATVTSVDGLDVVVQSREEPITTEEIRNLRFTVETPAGEEQEVRLADIASFSEAETLQSISRSLQRRYITVSGELKQGYNVTLVTAAAEEAFSSYTVAAGQRLEFDGENESIMSAMNDLLLMLLLGIVIVYLIMVAQFQSLLSPFIVLMTIPLAFTGGLFALLIAGFEISIVSMIGFVLLVGIIVNNGIVLIDCMNQLRLDGTERREAVIAACRTRLRPVLMTALTTILGLVPLALGWGTGAGLIQPVAIVAIGGLTYATLMTLFVVPVVYDALCRRPLRQLRQEDLAPAQE